MPYYSSTQSSSSSSGDSVRRKKGWTDTSMELAMQAVVYNGMSYRDAATQFGVPKSTLNDRISGKVFPVAVSGAPSYLTKEEEEELVSNQAGELQGQGVTIPHSVSFP